jgi:O-antigen/teichoic acid export membrane protein
MQEMDSDDSQSTSRLPQSPDTPSQSPITNHQSPITPKGFWRSGLVTRVLGLVDQAAISGVSLFTTVVVGRVAGEQALGLYALGSTLVVIAMAILYSLISLPYIVFSHRLRDRDLAEFSGSVVVHQGVLSVLVVVVLAGAALFWPLLQRLVETELAGLQAVLWVLAGTVAFVLLREFSRRVLMAEWRVLETVWLDLAVTVLQMVGLLGLAWAGVLSAGTAHAAVGLACAIGGFCWLVWAWKDFSFSRERVLPDWQRNWKLGCWEAGSQVVGLCQVFMLHWLLAVYLGPRATGIYAACVAVVALSNPFVVGIGNLLTPQAARAFAQEGRVAVGRVVSRTLLVVGLGMVGFTAGLALFGDWLVVKLYGPSYADNQQVIVLLAIAWLASALGKMLDQGLLAMEHSRWTFTFSFAGLLATLVAGVGLMMYHGLPGAATGLALGSGFATVLRGCVFGRMVLVRSQKSSSGVRDQRSEVRGQKSEIGRQESEQDSDGQRSVLTSDF